MIKLFVYFLRMPSRDFILTLNIIDIVMGVISTGILQYDFLVKVHHMYSSWIWLLDLALFIAAIVALFSYLSKRYYRSSAHRVYMIIRIFVSIFKFLFVTMVLVSYIQAISDNRSRHPKIAPMLYFIGLECYCLLSLYWSYHLMKIVN